MSSSSTDLTQRAIELTHAWFVTNTQSRQLFVAGSCLVLALLCLLQWLWFSSRFRRQRRRMKAVQQQFLALQRQHQQDMAALQDQLYTSAAAARHHEGVARELNAELAAWKLDAQKIELTKKELTALRERLAVLSQDIEKEKEECKREHERNRMARDKFFAEAEAMRTKELEMLNRANDARTAAAALEQRGAEAARQEQAVASERARLNHLEMQLEDELQVLEKRDERLTAREEALELRRQSIEEREAALPAMERVAAESSRRSAEEARRLADQREELGRMKWQLRMEKLSLEEARREVDSHRAALAAVAELYDAKREQVELWHRLISRQEGFDAMAALRPHE